MSYSENEQIEEQIHFSNIVATFERYEQHSVCKPNFLSFRSRTALINLQISANLRRRKDFLRIPVQDQKFLEEIGWKNKLDEIDAAIQANSKFLKKIIMNPEIFEEGENAEDEKAGGLGVQASTEGLVLRAPSRKARMTIHLADLH